MDSLAVHDEHGDHNNKNVLLAICDNSQESDDEMISPNYEGIQYEVHNVDGVLEYRFLNSGNNNSSNTLTTTATTTSVTTITGSDNCNNTNNGTGGDIGSSIATPTSATIVCNTNNTLPGTNCQFFVINDLSSTSTSSSSVASRPCLISPKISTDLTNDKSNVIGNSKKRDEKRRATHNEVERRRRDKINQWIFKLRDLLPENQEIINETTIKNKNSTSEYSKGGILVRACEYIRNLKEENDTFQECLKETETLRLQNATLTKELIKLQKENESLKKILLSAKIIKKSQKPLTTTSTTIQTSSDIIDLQEFESSS